MMPPPPTNRGWTSYPAADALAAAAISVCRAAILCFDGYPQSSCLHGITVTQLYVQGSTSHTVM